MSPSRLGSERLIVAAGTAAGAAPIDVLPLRAVLFLQPAAHSEGEQRPSPQVQDLRAPLVRLAVFGLLLPRRCRLDEQGRKLLTHHHAVEAGHRPAVTDVKAYHGGRAVDAQLPRHLHDVRLAQPRGAVGQVRVGPHLDVAVR
eukprot:scaffold109197_cov65-Phaeocystis_antarctica.AAC.2